jgi:hypothetical protein
MTDKERKSCICTIKMLRNLALNVHEVMDVIDYENCEKMISLLESSEQTVQQWISCDERLPEDEEEVIVSVRDDSGDNTFDYSSCGWYACAGDFWVVDNEANERVVAWMPLPEPWKDGE